MNMAQASSALLVLALCLLSGVADSRGFIHASRMWQDDHVIWPEFCWSATGFALGIGTYWLSLRFMSRLGIASPEVQTMVWFAVTIIGVALASGKFNKWPMPDRLIATVVVVGLGWLLIRSRNSA
jgi:hypothetical protein